MKKQSIQSLLTINWMASIGAIIVIGTASTFSIYELNHAIKESNLRANSVRLQMDSDMMHDALRGDALEAIKVQFENHAELLPDIQAATKEHGDRFIENMQQNIDLEKDELLKQQIIKTTNVAKNYIEKSILITKNPESLTQNKSQWEDFMKDFELLEVEMEKISDEISKKSEYSKENAEKISESFFYFLITLSSLSILLFLFINKKLSKAIKSPLRKLVETLRKIDEKNDLSLRIKNENDNEIGEVINEFNKMMGSLHKIVTDTVETSESLLGSSNSLKNSSSKTMDTLKKNMGILDYVSSKSSELSNNIAQISSSAAQANNSSNECLKLTNQVAITTKDADQEMQKIMQSVKQSSETILTLEAQVNGISEIAETIRGIAQQTNLLALNAAIEAARAGEQGRGFAVVADEVRVLAERTADSTLKISGIIDGIQSGTQDVVQQMKTGVERVEAGVNLTEDIIKQISGVTEHAQHAATTVSNISESLQKQDIAEQEIARKIEEVATSSAENIRIAQETSSISSNLSVLAEKLGNQVSKFSR